MNEKKKIIIKICNICRNWLNLLNCRELQLKMIRLSLTIYLIIYWKCNLFLTSFLQVSYIKVYFSFFYYISCCWIILTNRFWCNFPLEHSLFYFVFHFYTLRYKNRSLFNYWFSILHLIGKCTQIDNFQGHQQENFLKHNNFH